MMRWCPYSRIGKIFGRTLLCLLVHLGLCGSGQALIKRHLVIYGGLSGADLPAVAQNADILILDNIRHDYLVRLKQLNPRLLLFQYHHLTGCYRQNPGWQQVDVNEDWFAHDRSSGERLVEGKYGWYLMNAASESWRRYRAQQIAATTDEIFDGVFLDDAWPRFIGKFRCRMSPCAGRPPEEIVSGWTDHLRQILSEVRSRYPKRIFINGAHEAYIDLVDGCMEEAFVHPSWKPESDMPDPSSYQRMLLKIERLKKTGKTLLVQSGTSGADPGAVRQIFDFCLASYHLIEGPRTSFGFHRAPTYRYLGPLYDEDVNPRLGQPSAPWRIVQPPQYPPGLIGNGSFDQGWKHWQVLQGRPRIDGRSPDGGRSMKFASRTGGSDKITSIFFPVREAVRYRLAAVCKSESNRPGSRRYEKLGLQGRFYTKDRKRLPGAFDLPLDEGAYDWLPFETSFVSPPEAAFFRLRVGFIGNGTGKGWVSQIYFGPDAGTAMVVGRTFTAAEVLVNGGTTETSITANGAGAPSGQPVTLTPGGVAVIPDIRGASDRPNQQP